MYMLAGNSSLQPACGGGCAEYLKEQKVYLSALCAALARYAADGQLNCMQTIMKAAEGVPIEERVLINQLATSMVALSQASHGHCFMKGHALVYHA